MLKPGDYHPAGVPLVRIVDLEGDRIDEGGLFRIGRTLDAEFARSRLDGGEVLLSIQGTVGRVAIASERLRGANISRTIARINIAEGSSAEFVRHWMLSAMGQRAFDETIVGTTRSSLNIGALREIRVPLPPLPEQRRIAEILDTLDEAIRKTEQVIAKLQQIKQGLLHDLLTRGIDEHGELRDPERHPEQFKDSPLGRIPREWEVSSVAEQFDITAGITLGAHRRPRHHPHPYLRVANVYRDRIDLSDVASLEARPNDLLGKTLASGDLLVVEGHANPDEIGRCAMATEEVDGYTFQNHLFRLRPTRLSAGFALLWMNGASTRRYWWRMCSTSSGLNTINRSLLSAVPVAVLPVPEQQRVLALARGASSRIEQESEALRKLRTLKRGLMDDLLTGRVRVPTPGAADP
ncbi:MAG: restriction endonuclease subunit S [Myxococcales bacterium]|nr:restriction endonuclease subunit S [Myxococcales bacterium]